MFIFIKKAFFLYFLLAETTPVMTLLVIGRTAFFLVPTSCTPKNQRAMLGKSSSLSCQILSSNLFRLHRIANLYQYSAFLLSPHLLSFWFFFVFFSVFFFFFFLCLFFFFFFFLLFSLLFLIFHVFFSTFLAHSAQYITFRRHSTSIFPHVC